MRIGKWILLGVVLIGGVAVMLRPPRGISVQVAVATRGKIQSYVEEQGMTRLPQVYEVTMPLQGRVLPIELSEGAAVRQGQVVAQLDPSDSETEWIEASNTVKRYEKNIEQVDLAIQQADQTVLASQEEYKFLQNEFARTQRLFERQTATESERNQAEFKMIEARTDLRKDELNRSMYVIGRGMLELMRDTEKAKQEKVERDRKRMQIPSPVEGVVLSKVVSNERVLQAGAVLIRIGELAGLEVEADFLSQDAVEVRVGDVVQLEGPAIGPQPVGGLVTRIFPQGFTKVSSLGVEQQRVKVIAAFSPDAKQALAKSERVLGADYRVHVKVITAERTDALRIPRTALFRSELGDWQVFVIRNDKAELATVQIGLRNPYEVEVVSGLNEGDRVVVAPESALSAGQRVEIMAASR